jgi:hypothetical protein
MNSTRRACYSRYVQVCYNVGLWNGKSEQSGPKGYSLSRTTIIGAQIFDIWNPSPHWFEILGGQSQLFLTFARPNPLLQNPRPNHTRIVSISLPHMARYTTVTGLCNNSPYHCLKLSLTFFLIGLTIRNSRSSRLVVKMSIFSKYTIRHVSITTTRQV